MQSDTIILHFNSKKKTRGSKTSYVMNLPKPITHFKSFEVLGAEIPYSFYNFPRGNNYFCDIVDPNTDTVLDRLYSTSKLFGGNDYDKPLYLVIELDRTPYIINVTEYAWYGDYNYTNIATYIVGDASIFSACSIRNVGNKLEFTLTTVATHTMFTIKLVGTTPSLAQFLGISNDATVELLHPGNVATIRLPGLFRTVDPRDISYYIKYFGASGSTYTVTLADPNYGTVIPDPNGGWMYNRLTQLQFSTFLFDHSLDNKIIRVGERHIMAQLLGIEEGDYKINQYHNLPSYFIPPKLYSYYGQLSSRIDLYAYDSIGNWYGYSVSPIIGPGNYTSAQIVSAINDAIALVPDLAGSSASLNGAGCIILTFVLPGLFSTIAMYQTYHYGRRSMLDMLGFEDQWTFPWGFYGEESEQDIIVNGTNMASATFTASRPFNEKPRFLRIKSVTLGSLISSEYVMDDDPVFAQSNIIHKLQITSGPGTIIHDNQKYLSRKIVNKLKTPITSIDITLIDEDQ